MSLERLDPQYIRENLSSESKRLWGLGLTGKAIIFLLGLASILFDWNIKSSGVLFLVIIIFTEAALWGADIRRGVAQSLHRKLDFADSFGWEVSKDEVANLLARISQNFTRFRGVPKGPYFLSSKPRGVERALENLHESAWWTMHLAHKMFLVFILVIAITVIGCFIAINLSLEKVPVTVNGTSLERIVLNDSVVRAVTTTFLFVISFGMIRFAYSFYSLSSKAKTTCEQVRGLQSVSDCEQSTVIKLWQEYHLARASAPLLPKWIWTIYQKKLNELYSEYLKP
jgi:hypothetical protein